MSSNWLDMVLSDKNRESRQTSVSEVKATLRGIGGRTARLSMSGSLLRLRSADNYEVGKT